jgi:predicted DNA-binding transcriptional regulator YafY
MTSLESLSQKIKATLPPESMKYLKNVEQVLQVGIKPYKDYARFKEIINRVNEAAIQKKSVEMVYYTMSRKKEGRRKVEPYRIWFFNGTFYLIGCCHQRGEVRIFALDRIKMLHQTKDAFTAWKWGWKIMPPKEKDLGVAAQVLVFTGGDDEARTRDLRRDRSQAWLRTSLLNLYSAHSMGKQSIPLCREMYTR